MADAALETVQAAQRDAALTLAELLKHPLPAVCWDIDSWGGLKGQLDEAIEPRRGLAAWAAHLGVTVVEDQGGDGVLRGRVRCRIPGAAVEVWAEIASSKVAGP